MRRRGFLNLLQVACGGAIFTAISLAGGQQSGAPAATGSNPRVIFSRSINDPTANDVPAASPAPAKQVAAAPATNAERQAITFLSYDLDVRLQPDRHAIAVRARMVLRNDGEQPLRRLPLQVSSSLNWIAVRAADQPADFSVQTVASDTDHTGTLHEAVIALAQPVAPRQTVAVDATYQGTIELASHRLEHIGAPADVAELSDRDRSAPILSDYGALATWSGIPRLRSRRCSAMETNSLPR